MEEGIALAERTGRIAGIWKPNVGMLPLPAAMRSMLGERGQVLEAKGAVADADACWLDGAPVRSWSDAPLDKIDGAFAFASFDGETLRLASDPSGHRSLYYFRTLDGTVIFASQLQLILASGLVARNLNHKMIAFYLSFAYLPGPETLIAGLSVLPVGSVLQASKDHLSITPFWTLPPDPSVYQDEATLRTRLRAVLEASVQRALPEEGAKVGAFLSGGIDSSLVVALMRRQHGGPMRCWSVSFGAGHANELPFSAMVAQHCQSEQEVVEIQPAHIKDDFDKTVQSLSEPNGDPLTVPNYRMFQRAQEFGVVLNGEGGDPCFGGPKNAPMLLVELLGDGDEDEKFFRERNYLRAHLKCYDELSSMLEPSVLYALEGNPLETFIEGWFEDQRWSSFLNRLMAINVAFKGAHHILPKVDHLGAPFGVVARSPLFDRRVVEMSFEIPAVGKRKGSIEKYLLKEAVRDLLPAAVVDRPKSGMMVPVEAWFQGPLLPWARERLLDGLASYKLIKRSWMEALLAGKLGGLRPRRGVKIWLLLTLESWLRGNIY
jgi:asparagine synthase (glutamine-hydrolysing)